MKISMNEMNEISRITNNRCVRIFKTLGELKIKKQYKNKFLTKLVD